MSRQFRFCLARSETSTGSPPGPKTPQPPARHSHCPHSGQRKGGFARCQAGAELGDQARRSNRSPPYGPALPAESDRSDAATPGADASSQLSSVPVRAAPAGMDDGASRLVPAPASTTSRLCCRTLRRLGGMRATYRVYLRRGTGPDAASPQYCRGAIAIVRADRGRER